MRILYGNAIAKSFFVRLAPWFLFYIINIGLIWLVRYFLGDIRKCHFFGLLYKMCNVTKSVFQPQLFIFKSNNMVKFWYNIYLTIFKLFLLSYVIGTDT